MPLIILQQNKRLIGLCSRREITIEECINLTKFSRATIYKLRKNLFPDSINNIKLSDEIEETLKKMEK